MKKRVQAKQHFLRSTRVAFDAQRGEAAVFDSNLER